MGSLTLSLKTTPVKTLNPSLVSECTVCTQSFFPCVAVTVRVHLVTVVHLELIIELLMCTAYANSQVKLAYTDLNLFFFFFLSFFKVLYMKGLVVKQFQCDDVVKVTTCSHLKE